MTFRLKNVYWLWVSAAVMLLDQITKQLVVKSLGWFDVYPLFPSFNLVHMRNTGAAFSIMRDAPPVFFILLGVAVSVGILWWLRRNPQGQPLVASGLSLILGGALGNVIDRATRGYVIDFLDFYFGAWHYPAFNVADMAITLGAGLLILDMIRDGRRAKARSEVS
ncbi:MAG: lipoprotein signal peptidase [Gammaproteobacteria bacterium]|nr:lipoprotein signal peptidase [Gammaproteobacteria bacterium]